MLALIVKATAAALIAAASVLPAARPGMHCASGGRAIGEDIRNGYFIATVLELRSREDVTKVVGYIYAGSDGQDYLQRIGQGTHIMRAGEVPPGETYMMYCFSKPWMGK